MEYWYFRYDGAPVILVSRIGKNKIVQNKPTPTDPYEAKTQSWSSVHKINSDYQSLVISFFCNHYAITNFLVL